MGMTPRSSMPVIVVDEMGTPGTSRTRRASQLAIPIAPMHPLPKVHVAREKEEEDGDETDPASITHLLNRNRN
jgi:hypothetical protein